MTPERNGAPLNQDEIIQELQMLAQQQVIPSQLADKLGEKLIQKNVSLTSNQLHKLVEKIASLLNQNGAGNVSSPALRVSPKSAGSSETMKDLVDEIETLKERIAELEMKKSPWQKDKTGKMVTTEDIIDAEDVYGEEFKPLTEISNDPESIIVLMKWLQHLVDHVGKNNLPDVLSYYVDIHWITDDVRLNLIEYAKGIIEETTSDKLTRSSSTLPTRDHIRSLLFIQKLKGQRVDDRFMGKIDREMEKMQKSLNSYYQQ